jgi:murein DD-endopeptidase MepM/ murein hydrolase activator NlpD
VIPVPGYAIGTPYGRRGSYWSCSPDAYGNGIHTGTDYPAPVGTKIVAARPGTAVYCNHGSAFGSHQLEIRCGDGTRDFYAHMTTRTVNNGAKVSAGQSVGKVGAEGNVTGPHLHFERHATETGGWSCSVVRDPAPSINYQPSSSGGSGSGGGSEDDMPEYGSAKIAKSVKLSAGTWTAITFDTINGGDCFTKGKPGIAIGGKRYVMCLTAKITGRNGKTVRTNVIERDGDETVESNPAVTHDRDNIGDTRVGSCGKGRVLRVRVLCDGPATLESALVTIVYW